MKLSENSEFEYDKSSLRTGMLSSNFPQYSDDYENLTDDLRTLLALVDLAKYHKDYNVHLLERTSKLRFFRLVKLVKKLFLQLYFLLVFFEKPFWCYKSNSLFGSDPNKKTSDNECDPNIPVMGLPYLDHSLNRLIEMLLIVFFSAALIYHRKVKSKYRSLLSRIRVVLICSFFTVCFFDNFFSVFYNSFPMLNFILRGILIILLSRKLREEWTKIFFVIYYTRSIFFILFFCVIVFGLLGHQIFQGEFEQIYTSIDAMFVLITTANFPDIMLKNIDQTKFAIFFFIGYLLITYFVIVSLLKALYYSNYLEIKKSLAKTFLQNLRNEVISNDEKNKLKKYLNTLAKQYSLSKDEIEKFKNFIGEAQNQDQFPPINVADGSSLFLEEAFEEANIRQFRVFRVLRSKYLEILINCVNIVFICLLVIRQKPIFLTFLHLLMCLYFILEFIPYIRFYSLKKLIFKKFLRCLFFFINLCGFFMHLLFILAEVLAWDGIRSNEKLLALARILILLRSLRVFILLNMFQDFRNIFSTIRNMKNVFGSLLASLFSFFFVFSTVSIILFGGKITMEEYQKISSIPNEYANINFNDYGSSFLLCFCLVIYNNMNMLIDHMCSHYDLLMKPYFTFFYFLAILIILNIFQTFVLDMYLNVKKTKVKVRRSVMAGDDFFKF